MVEACVRLKEKATVTDEPAYWKLPTSINKVQPEVGHQINFISAAATRRSLDRQIDGETNTSSTQRTRMAKTTPPPPPTPDKLAIFYRQLSMTGTGSAIVSVLPDHCELFRDPVLPIRSLQSLVTGTGLNRSDLPALQLRCQIIKIAADVSEEQAVQMERRTRGQHTSSLWFAARAGRVTASSMHGVYGTDLSSTALSIVKRVCYPARGPGTSATIWEIRQEETGRQAYTAQTAHQHTDQQVQTCGFFVNPAFPQVGASPMPLSPAPVVGKDCTILQACSSEDRNFCLYVVDGQVHLKKNHQYYTQVQTQLFVTESSYCDFVVWTLMDTVILRIAPDTAFWKKTTLLSYMLVACAPTPPVRYEGNDTLGRDHN
uniref:YqaJ viral recombinase domain-containing protein n=1 Tax=Gouania willdenowi TaxID=441366 RepID=A0A8C5EMQ3_GOUWI